jgi:hypothetical protein
VHREASFPCVRRNLLAQVRPFQRLCLEIVLVQGHTNLRASLVIVRPQGRNILHASLEFVRA